MPWALAALPGELGQGFSRPQVDGGGAQMDTDASARKRNEVHLIYIMIVRCP